MKFVAGFGRRHLGFKNRQLVIAGEILNILPMRRFIGRSVERHNCDERQTKRQKSENRDEKRMAKHKFVFGRRRSRGFTERHKPFLLK